MQIPTQLHLIFELDRLRTAIHSTKKLELILGHAQQAHDLAMPVPIDPEFHYKIEGKQRTLHMLTNEIRQYARSKTEIEVIQFSTGLNDFNVIPPVY